MALNTLKYQINCIPMLVVFCICRKENTTKLPNKFNPVWWLAYLFFFFLAPRSGNLAIELKRHFPKLIQNSDICQYLLYTSQNFTIDVSITHILHTYLNIYILNSIFPFTYYILYSYYSCFFPHFLLGFLFHTLHLSDTTVYF